MESGINIRIAERSDFKRWNEYLLDVPGAHFLQTAYMARVFQFISFRPTLVIVEKSEKVIGGLMSYRWFSDSKFAPVRFFSRLNSHYGPVLSQEEANVDLLKKIFEFVDQIANNQFTMDHHILFIPYRGIHDVLKSLGYTKTQYSLQCTFVVNLQKQTQDLWKSLERSRRGRIRKAENFGLRIVEGTRNNSPKIFHELHLSTTRRLGILPDPYSFIEAIWRTLVPTGNAKFYFAYYKEVPIAGAIITTYKKRMYYYMSASLKEFQRLYPNNLLQWRIMLDGKSNGYESYDLMGSPGKGEIDHPEYGLYLFKRSFGGEMVQLGPSYSKVFSSCALRLWDSILVPSFKKMSSALGHL